jgi:hypothetical protein
MFCSLLSLRWKTYQKCFKGLFNTDQQAFQAIVSGMSELVMEDAQHFSDPDGSQLLIVQDIIKQTDPQLMWQIMENATDDAWPLQTDTKDCETSQLEQIDQAVNQLKILLSTSLPMASFDGASKFRHLAHVFQSLTSKTKTSIVEKISVFSLLLDDETRCRLEVFLIEKISYFLQKEFQKAT